VADFINSQEDREATLSAARYAALRLPERPRLAPWLVAVDLGDDRLQLRSAEASHTLAHPLLIQVFRRIETILDGRHTLAEIASSGGPDVLPTTVVFLLKLLHGKGLLQPGIEAGAPGAQEQARWRGQLRFLGHFVEDAASAQALLAKARVGVAGAGDLPQAISSALGSVGVGHVAQLGEPSAWRTEPDAGAAPPDLIVACAESPAFDFFEAVNAACLASGTRWLRVAVAGTSAQLGPTVVPNQTACHTCLDLRLRTHQPDLDGYLAYRARAGASGRGDEGGIAPLRSVVAGQAALEVVRILTGFAPPVTVGRFYELGAVSPAAVPHDVLRVPRCPSCGRRRTFAEAWDQGLAAMDGGS
jgi:bacteriocin biosynthesis cyclodehydratase domain-containing protein